MGKATSILVALLLLSMTCLYGAEPAFGTSSTIWETILYTEDGGATWTGQNPMVWFPLYGADFIDGETGWAVGAAIIHTTDGGQHWENQSIFNGYINMLRAVDFHNSTTGWTVGDNGIIMNTSNSGISWQNQTSGTKKNLNSVCFIDENLGWAVGDTGIVLNTSDGGKQWHIQRQGQFNETLNDIHFAYAGWGYAGWAAGYTENGSLIYTGNGGRNWTAVDPWTPKNRPINPLLTGIELVVMPGDVVWGWAVGEDVIHTNNSGTNWTVQKKDVFMDNIEFAGSNCGWLVGSSGGIMNTSNGGKTWDWQITNHPGWLSCAVFVNETTGWAFSTTKWAPPEYSMQLIPVIFCAALFRVISTRLKKRKNA